MLKLLVFLAETRIERRSGSGASGVAVQKFNPMFGYDERTKLT